VLPSGLAALAAWPLESSSSETCQPPRPPIAFILIVGIVSLAVRRGIGNIFFVDPIVIAFFESLGVATILVFEQSRAIRHDLIALATFSSNVGAIGLTLALVSPTEM